VLQYLRPPFATQMHVPHVPVRPQFAGGKHPCLNNAHRAGVTGILPWGHCPDRAREMPLLEPAMRCLGIVWAESGQPNWTRMTSASITAPFSAEFV